MRSIDYQRRTRRNPSGAMFIDKTGAHGPKGMKHPIRSWAGYDPARTNDGERKTARKAAPSKAAPPPAPSPAPLVPPVKRTPVRRAPPSHDLFGERSHRTSFFGEKTYAAVPKPKRQPEAAKKGKPAGAQQGALRFARGFFD